MSVPSKEALRRPADWLEGCGHGPVSELGANAAYVLAFMAGGGIHNAPVAFERVDWSDDQCLRVHWGFYLCNWDSPSLTALWAWCAELMLRVEVSPASPTHIELQFFQRRSRHGSVGRRLPDRAGQVKWVGIDV